MRMTASAIHLLVGSLFSGASGARRRLETVFDPDSNRFKDSVATPESEGAVQAGIHRGAEQSRYGKASGVAVKYAR